MSPGSTEWSLVDDYRRRLDGLMREGRELRSLVSTDRSSQPALAKTRSWQAQCAATVNVLSGGSKAHWLARAFSGAFLVRSAAGEAVEEAPVTEIVDRLLGVLEQADRSLAGIVEDSAASAVGASRPHRFEFVHDVALRPVLEQAYVSGRAALERGQCGESLIIMCGIIEAVLTDALEHSGPSPHEWSFQTRIDAAEQAGLIRGGCARLPPIARRYRDLADAGGELHGRVKVTEREARVTSQVLHVVIRDLDPGR